MQAPKQHCCRVRASSHPARAWYHLRCVEERLSRMVGEPEASTMMPHLVRRRVAHDGNGQVARPVVRPEERLDLPPPQGRHVSLVPDHRPPVVVRQGRAQELLLQRDQEKEVLSTLKT